MLTDQQTLESDNLRLHKQGDPLAVAAARFMDSVAKGTAFIHLPDHDGKAMKSNGGRMFYRSLAGDVYEATMVAKVADRLVIDVKVPGVAEPVRMHNIKFAQGRPPSDGHPPSTGEPPTP